LLLKTLLEILIVEDRGQAPTLGASPLRAGKGDGDYDRYR
jgi:hypothetical protein